MSGSIPLREHVLKPLAVRGFFICVPLAIACWTVCPPTSHANVIRWVKWALAQNPLHQSEPPFAIIVELALP